MNLFKKIICLFLLLIMLILPFAVWYDVKEEIKTETLKEDFFRLHIRANSDTKEDQELKLKVRDKVLKLTTELFKKSKNKKAAIKTAVNNLSLIKKTAESEVKRNGYSYPVKVQIKRENFPYREYDGFYLPKGTYDSLSIEIGKGSGKNWWCVLFPAVCLSGAGERPETNLEKVPEAFRLPDKINKEKIVFKFWLYESLKSIFGRGVA